MYNLTCTTHRDSFCQHFDSVYILVDFSFFVRDSQHYNKFQVVELKILL